MCKTLWIFMLLYFSSYGIASITIKENDAPKFDGSLWNKHLKIAAKHWIPFLSVDADSKGNIVYGGIMFELLKFMQQARNLTFTIISEGTEWGTCDENDVCSGMFEMVNNSQVDMALGKN